MSKRIYKIAAAVIFVLVVASISVACSVSSNASDDDIIQKDADKHLIGMTVYDTSDSQVIMFNDYLQDYLCDQCFDDVQIVCSDNLSSVDERLAFIDEIGEMGGEGVLGFYCQDLEAEVNECAKYGMYYLIPSGTVSDEDLAKVEDNEYFLGEFGPGTEMEYQAGYDMATFFAEEEGGSNYLILSGGTYRGNEMHIQRVHGMLDALQDYYGVDFGDVDDAVSSDTSSTLTAGEVSVTVCPGFVSDEQTADNVLSAFEGSDYDYCMSTIPVAPIVESANTGNVTMGAVDCYSQENQLLFEKGKLAYLTGKYGSSVGPAFAAMYNAVTGHAADFRDNGKAFRITQGFWTSSSKADFEDKYEFASSVTVNAYNYEDVQSVCKEYNPEASLQDLVDLAGAYSFDDAKARRNM